MSLPVNARVQAAESFVPNVQSIREFLELQDSTSAETRVIALAAAHGVPEVREWVLKPCVLLYAHGRDRGVLLALKRERQLLFQIG